MNVIILTAIIIFILKLLYSNESRNSSYSNISLATGTSTNPIVTSTLPIQTTSSSQSKSFIPQKISKSPVKTLSLVDGEYRYFENHFVNGVQYSFGFPKVNCIDRRVWVGIGKIEIERITNHEARRRTNSQFYISNQIKSITTSSHVKLITTSNITTGYCSNCGKKLRGNIYKKNCTVCYQKGFR